MLCWSGNRKAGQPIKTCAILVHLFLCDIKQGKEKLRNGRDNVFIVCGGLWWWLVELRFEQHSLNGTSRIAMSFIEWPLRQLCDGYGGLGITGLLLLRVLAGLQQTDKIDLDVVRLCFQAFLPDDNNRFTRIIRPIVSQRVVDKRQYHCSDWTTFLLSIASSRLTRLRLKLGTFFMNYTIIRTSEITLEVNCLDYTVVIIIDLFDAAVWPGWPI